MNSSMNSLELIHSMVEILLFTNTRMYLQPPMQTFVMANFFPLMHDGPKKVSVMCDRYPLPPPTLPA